MKDKILNYLLNIPKGKVISYKIIGETFDIHSRLVAKILSSNDKQDIYPCYKVINHNGKIGGYNLGVDEKIKRLENDGIKIINGKIDKKYFYFPR